MPSFADCFARNQGSLNDEQQHLLQKKRVAVIDTPLFKQTVEGMGGYSTRETGHLVPLD